MPADALRDVALFSTPLEIGLRAVVMLEALHPRVADLQRLVYLDYLLVHSGDVEGGPPSLHPPTPHRSGEILVKRAMLSQGLRLMSSRELVTQLLSESGLTFQSSNVAEGFLTYLDGDYASQLKLRAAWIAQSLGNRSDDDIANMINSHIGEWGGEFTSESLVREAVL
jgi:hypothetical protein